MPISDLKPLIKKVLKEMIDNKLDYPVIKDELLDISSHPFNDKVFVDRIQIDTAEENAFIISVFIKPEKVQDALHKRSKHVFLVHIYWRDSSYPTMDIYSMNAQKTIKKGTFNTSDEVQMAKEIVDELVNIVESNKV